MFFFKFGFWILAFENLKKHLILALLIWIYLFIYLLRARKKIKLNDLVLVWGLILTFLTTKAGR
jgi:hypothetical protein